MRTLPQGDRRVWIANLDFVLFCVLAVLLSPFARKLITKRARRSPWGRLLLAWWHRREWRALNWGWPAALVTVYATAHWCNYDWLAGHSEASWLYAVRAREAFDAGNMRGAEYWRHRLNQAAKVDVRRFEREHGSGVRRVAVGNGGNAGRGAT